MGTATAAAPKPQPAPPCPSMAQPYPGHPSPMAMTVAELETEVAALPGKRDALQQAFDRLAACSPSPLPFAWEDLDAHLSSLQSSISLRFRQFQVLEAARNAPAAAAFGVTRGGRTAGILEEEEEAEEEMVVAEEEGEEAVEEEELVVEQNADEEMQGDDYDEPGEKIGDDRKDENEGAVEEEDEVMDEEEVEADANDKFGNEMNDEKGAMEEEQASEVGDEDADEEMQVADEEELNTKDAFNASWGKEEEQDTNMDATMTKNAMQGKEEEEATMEDHDTNMDQMVTKKASAMQGKEEEASMEEQDTDMDEMAAKKASAAQGDEEEAVQCSAMQGGKKHEEEAVEHGVHEEEEDAKNATKEEAIVAKEVSRDQGNQDLPGRFNDRTAACASMDAQRLIKLICTNTRLNSDFHNAVCRGPDAAALILQVVELFLHNKILKTKKVWATCVGLIQMVPVAVTKPSAETVERAKQVARDWNEMIDNPGSCKVLGNLASWGLIYFLISYNIVSEFDTKEIFRFFAAVPRKKKHNSVLLFKASGLTDRIPDLMDYLIENGQQLDVLYLARFLNLVDKHTPLSLLKGYVERAKQTAMEVSEKNMTRQSLRAVIIKEIDNLKRADNLAQQHITDSSLCTSVRAEIYDLLCEFGKKKRSLANASTASTSNSQQQQMESIKKHEKEQKQEHHKGQENQQQGEASKLGEELVKIQNKPQQEQLQKQEDKPKEKQQQKQEDNPKEKRQENNQKPSKRRRQHTPNLASPAVRSMASRGHFGYPPYASHFGYPPYASMHHHGYPSQPGWPGNHFATPFVPQLGAPGYIGPFDPFCSRPKFYPW